MQMMNHAPSPIRNICLRFRREPDGGDDKDTECLERGVVLENIARRGLFVLSMVNLSCVRCVQTYTSKPGTQLFGY